MNNNPKVLISGGIVALIGIVGLIGGSIYGTSQRNRVQDGVRVVQTMQQDNEVIKAKIDKVSSRLSSIYSVVDIPRLDGDGEKVKEFFDRFYAADNPTKYTKLRDDVFNLYKVSDLSRLAQEVFVEEDEVLFDKTSSREVVSVEPYVLSVDNSNYEEVHLVTVADKVERTVEGLTEDGKTRTSVETDESTRQYMVFARSTTTSGLRNLDGFEVESVVSK